MRLIDADALKEKMYHEAFEKDSDMQKWDSGCWIRYKLFENVLREQPTVTPEPQWIPVTERLPKEEDSIFARYYGTDRWRKSMFRKKSREVIVTSVFEDGELHTEVAHTTDGEWHVGVNVVPRTVIAWMPLPEPFKGVNT